MPDQHSHISSSLSPPFFLPPPFLLDYDQPIPAPVIIPLPPRPKPDPTNPSPPSHCAVLEKKPDPCSFTDSSPPCHRAVLEKKPDPCSFTDSSPPCHRAVLEKFPPMVKLTFDLTASDERKGVAMAEPAATMVPRTPDHPANPGIGAPLMANDAVVTKTESKTKNIGFIFCDLCNVTCNSEMVFKIHIQGKLHKKNAQKLTLPSTINNPSPTANNTYTPNHTSDQKLNGIHTNKCLNKDIDSVTEPPPASCQLCGVLYSSPDVRAHHLSGKKHQKNLRKSGKQPLPCPVPVAAVPQHDPMKAAVVPLPGSIKEKGEVVAASKRKADGSVGSDHHGDVNTKRQKVNDFSAICKVCNEVCKGVVAFETHMASSKHLEMAMKQARTRWISCSSSLKPSSLST